jgi:NADH-quinone oxidoreductase subunit F
MADDLILLKNMDNPDARALEFYKAGGGYQALKKALDMQPAEITEEVKKAGVRGRGGAGFPAGVKWGFVPKQSDKPKYLCCNADEGEPGTFKDRAIMEWDPHMLLEGMVIACYAIGIHTAYIYIRGEFHWITLILEQAIEEARAANLLGPNILGSGFDCEIYMHEGAGAYICGEETALIESLEGKRGQPRLKPPFPAVVGVFGGPTVVNNVETLACVPHIIDRGAEWFTSIGPERNAGPKIFPVSGHVRKPGNYELPMGTPLREIIYDVCGGIPGDKKIKAVIPGGSSTPVLTADEIDVNMDFDSLAAIGSMFGAGSIIVMDETTCMVRAAMILARFYAHESCGQCTPCREGVPWMHDILKRIMRGEGKPEDPDLLLDICVNIEGNTICPLGDAAVGPVRSIVNKFRDEFDYYIEHGRSSVGDAGFDFRPGD